MTAMTAAELAEFLQEQVPVSDDMGRVFRQTFDQAYNGQNTRRYRPDQLSKTESAHIGSLLEINLRREFDRFIGDGNEMDYRICGVDVDCKYSKQPFGWMIPQETVGHFALLCHANEYTSRFRMGVLKITPDVLNNGANRDQKTTIRSAKRSEIQWAWFDEPYPPNTLLQLDESVVDKIFTQQSGQKSLNELFRQVQGELVPRGVVATVAYQKDFMKRIRANGGSRTILRPEGIIILGDYLNDQRIAEALDIPVPRDGDSIAVRVVPAETGFNGPAATIGSRSWRIATDNDPIYEAPIVPRG